MLSQVVQGRLRSALLELWLEPWLQAKSAWCSRGVWPDWLEWVSQERPELLQGLWPEWCKAVGAESGASTWLEAGAPLDGGWREVAYLCALTPEALTRVLVMCGAVSVFSRPDAGAVWVESQAHLRDDAPDDAFMPSLLAGWRLSRLYSLAPAEGWDASLVTSQAYVDQGLRVLLAGARACWGRAWELAWPHWRWRLAPVCVDALGVDVRQHVAPSVSLAPTGFARVWAQAMAREEAL